MAVWTYDTKNTSTWDYGEWFLLQELGDYLLQENGDKIVLDQSPGTKNTASWTFGTKH